MSNDGFDADRIAELIRESVPDLEDIREEIEEAQPGALERLNAALMALNAPDAPDEENIRDNPDVLTLENSGPGMAFDVDRDDAVTIYSDAGSKQIVFTHNADIRYIINGKEVTVNVVDLLERVAALEEALKYYTKRHGRLNLRNDDG